MEVRLVQAGVLPELDKVLGAHTYEGNREFVDQILQAMVNMSSSAEAQRELLSLPFPSTLVAALTEFKHDRAICEDGAKVLGHLTQIEEMRWVLINADILPRVKNCMDGHREDAGIQYHFARAVGVLATNGACASAPFVEDDSSPPSAPDSRRACA